MYPAVDRHVIGDELIQGVELVRAAPCVERR
jgi:hypothetical protein